MSAARSPSPISVPRIEALHVRNYRALASLDLKGITPLTVLLGPNGSGKTTVFDVFAFLSECFSSGLRKAWDKRGRFRELKTRGTDGPVVIEIKYRERHSDPLITYHVAIREDPKGPYLAEEWLQWRRKESGRPLRFLDFGQGAGHVISGDRPDEDDARIPEDLQSRELLAVNSLGQLKRHPRVSALRDFITSWHLSYLTAESSRSVPEAGPQERLSPTGDNLANVAQYLAEQHPARLRDIFSILASRVPRLEKVTHEVMPDGRLLLLIKDAPFDRPILAKYASDGTLKMLACLLVLHDPSPPSMIGIEEPENHLHPLILPALADECRSASIRTQLMVTTHSPHFVNGIRANELWLLNRNDAGHTEALQASAAQGVGDFVSHGGLLGDLWMEGYLTCPAAGERQEGR
ncbi:MAG: AAA family ATPase [Candidatus Riflebacteria bacterium]|nr:AAA family ATPase [Candidatus Riflebacteria bacterium]